jgi:hypothetical protein
MVVLFRSNYPTVITMLPRYKYSHHPTNVTDI